MGVDKEKNIRESIRMLVRKLGLLQKSESSCCGITLAQCHAMVEIGRMKEISLVDLSEVLNLDKSTMSRTINNLVNDGLAHREINQNDRRYLTISLTEKGQKIFEEIEESMNVYFGKICDDIPKDKLEQVIESLGLLIDAINKNK